MSSSVRRGTGNTRSTSGARGGGRVTVSARESRELMLPPVPLDQKGVVKAWSEAVEIPTYEPMAPDRNPMFLERRVYQGSSGRVYPLPFYDRIAERATARKWEAVHLENEYLRVMVLPELGGRVHVVRDKKTGYDLVYRQDVIKPALVGLAGPWVSGGIEFNWPQHHRPATYMPVSVSIEEGEDGSRTVWCGDHDPMCRMLGVHGVCLRPGRAQLELRVRLYNRTPYTQTFLWWANVATRVHERYQSFFPPDVYYVADHAKRATSRYPRCDGRYYGVDYARRGREGVPAGETPGQFVPGGEYRADDLSWYANIPVPTSYMCMGSREDFFGGYDHAAGVGILHVANHHVAPGKKQWTWGNHAFGYAWDRNLTDPDAGGVSAPYIELMAGVYTDNQPDFSFLSPGETKTFSQYWSPIHAIGPAQQANREAAVSLGVKGKRARVGVSVTGELVGARVVLTAGKKTVKKWAADLRPGEPLVAEVTLPRGVAETDLAVVVTDAGGREVIGYRPARAGERPVPPAATEPAAPGEIASADELYTTGLHLEQYRHATRMPEAYWLEALRRDPLDVRCNTAMGHWHLKRGEFARAEEHFRRAIERQTSRNPNPAEGEAYYGLGLTLRFLGRDTEAYDAIYKATWNAAWQGPAHHALAEIDAARGEWEAALDHLDRSLRVGVDNLRARDLKVVALRHLGRVKEAADLLSETLRIQPLDWWARYLAGEALACDAGTCLDVALDCARAGLAEDALEILGRAKPTEIDGLAPLLHYHAAVIASRAGDAKRAERELDRAAKASPTYCHPARLEDLVALEFACAGRAKDARARYYLGNLMYDRRRYAEAVKLWSASARIDASFATVWRNLGIAQFNVKHDAEAARRAFDKAFAANPADARVLYELDQLARRVGKEPAARLRRLVKHADLVMQRDDLSVELCALYNQTGRHEAARELLAGRNFQPWEGGEGLALGQHVRTHLSLGRIALSAGDAAEARALFEAALAAPGNLGEARHLLANQSDVHYFVGLACARCGDEKAAKRHLAAAADFEGDFQEMSVRPFSELTYYSALAARELGRKGDATRLLTGLLGYARELRRSEAKVDYFATSLPTMLLFADDLQRRQEIVSLVLEGQALLGLGKARQGKAALSRVLELDPMNATAKDLLEGAN